MRKLKLTGVLRIVLLVLTVTGILLFSSAVARILTPVLTASSFVITSSSHAFSCKYGIVILSESSAAIAAVPVITEKPMTENVHKTARAFLFFITKSPPRKVFLTFPLKLLRIC